MPCGQVPAPTGHLQLCPPGSEQVFQNFPGLFTDAVTDQPRAGQESTPFTGVCFHNERSDCNLFYRGPSVGVSVQHLRAKRIQERDQLWHAGHPSVPGTGTQVPLPGHAFSGRATPHAISQGARLSPLVQPSCFAVRKPRHSQGRDYPESHGISLRVLAMPSPAAQNAPPGKAPGEESTPKLGKKP